jgi:L,D-transpeptidase catalytic domain
MSAGAATSSARGAHTCAAASRWLESWKQTYAAQVVDPSRLYREPGRHPFTSLSTSDRYGFPTTVTLLERRTLCGGARWYRIRYAHWPNGSSGWIRAHGVRTTRLHIRIVVDESRHELWLYKRGRVMLKTPAAIGKPSTPTPLGTFFVTQRFLVTDQFGPYGPRAIGISAFSNVLRAWTDGGPIGIHGTNEPFSIGKPVSHGCIRLPNRVILRLFAIVPLGTPVTIRR